MLLFKRYEYNPQADLIGKGGFSRVYRALDKKLNRMVALKIYKTDEIADKYSPIAEIQRVIEFDHPNISRYIDIEEIENENAFGEKEKIQVCVMELLSGGNLSQYYQSNPDIKLFKKLLLDVLNGLSYLHQNDIIHRDIKPGNILIKNTVKGPVAKITDFGISKRSDSSFNSTSSALIVSIPYMAPEQLNVQKYGIDEKISYNIDLWSLGVTVYEIISGQMLFKNDVHESSEQIMTNIMMPELPAKIDLLPQPFRDFVHLCIVKDAKERVKKAEDLVPVLERKYETREAEDREFPNSQYENTPPEDISKPVLPVLDNLSEGAKAAKRDKQAPGDQTEKEDVTAIPSKKDRLVIEKVTANPEDELSAAISPVFPEEPVSDQIIVPPGVTNQDDTITFSKKDIPVVDEDLPADITQFLPKTNAGDDNILVSPVNDETSADDTITFSKKDIPVVDEDLPADITQFLPKTNAGDDDILVTPANDEPPTDDTRTFSKKDIPLVDEDLPADITQFLPKTNAGDDDILVTPANDEPPTDDTRTFSKKDIPLVDEDLPANITQFLPKTNAGEEDIVMPPVMQHTDDDDTVSIPKKENSLYPVDENASNPGPKNKNGVTEPIIDANSPVSRIEKPVNLFHRYDYYPVSDLIGKGGFSRVYKAYDKKLNRWVALKIYKTGEFSERYSPISEIRRVVNLDHPNICRYLDIEEIEKENPFGENEITQICVMELMDSGNFAEYYQKTAKLDILKKLLRDVLNGLAYLHRNGIIHRDIKPANILIKTTTEGAVAKITDFGISKAPDNINSDSSSSIVVSIPYMAPEQLNIRKYGIDEKISYNLDLWALGVTIYEIITGNVLFKNNENDSSEQIMTNIMSAGTPEKINELPEPFRKIVTLCVIKNARERVKRAEDLLQYLDKPESPVTPVAEVIPQPAEPQPVTPVSKRSLFLEEEKKIPTKKIAIKEIKNPGASRGFSRNFSKPVIGLIAVIIIVPLIIFLQPWRSHKIPATGISPLTDILKTKDSTGSNTKTGNDLVKKDSVVGATAVNTNPVTTTTEEIRPGKESSKPEEHKPEKEKITVRNEPATSVVAANSKIKIRIRTSKTCSVKILDGKNKNFDSIDRISAGQEDYQEYFPPGTYIIIATELGNPSNISQGKLVVTTELSGKKNYFTINWK